ncbi:MAG: peptide transporter [Rhodobacterales bacterium]|nr:MAG: peptide transporter [Rhodobacterales bacterium]
MLECFFPKPKEFFGSLLVWCILVVFFWYFGGKEFGSVFGFEFLAPDAPPVIGLGHFTTPDFLWFYIYFVIITAIFYGFWSIYSPHKWQVWSILGSAFILFITYYQVQVAVAVNNWYRPFYDAIQNALSNESTTTAADLYGYMFSFLILALTYVLIAVFTSFFVSHYVFRWRTAMNDYYTSKWKQVRHIEGASQRIQEDTMRFASIMKSLGVSIVDSVMTLIAFLPVLLELSKNVKEIPLVGEIAYPLFYAAIFWSIFGTILMIVAGIKLPGLEFRNQRVEAAFRKELVLGEDDEARAEPQTLKELFANVRRNYFRIYIHYTYFNLFRNFYFQLNNLFAYILLIPTIAAGAITLGIMNQIIRAFSEVTSSFQYLVRSWSTIIDLISVFKRLQAFEAAFKGEELSNLDKEYIETKGKIDY